MSINNQKINWKEYNNLIQDAEVYWEAAQSSTSWPGRQKVYDGFLDQFVNAIKQYNKEYISEKK